MVVQKTEKYFGAVGRRKRAVARVRITPSSKQTYLVNEKNLDVYFPIRELQMLIQKTFTHTQEKDNFLVEVHVKGGGITSQAEAIRHGIARALVVFEETLRGPLKGDGYLRRDSRVKERKKFGLRKARRAPQWSKR